MFRQTLFEVMTPLVPLRSDTDDADDFPHGHLPQTAGGLPPENAVIAIWMAHTGACNTLQVLRRARTRRPRIKKGGKPYARLLLPRQRVRPRRKEFCQAVNDQLHGIRAPDPLRKSLLGISRLMLTVSTLYPFHKIPAWVAC